MSRPKAPHHCEDTDTVAALAGVVMYHAMETKDYQRDDETMPEYVGRQLRLLRANLGTVRP